MARGKKGTSEKEIEEAVERMRRHPESLRSALHDETWFNFLADIEVREASYSTARGQSFWLDVKDRIGKDIETYTGTRRVQLRDSKGHFTSEFTSETYYYVIYRSAITKKLIGYEIIK